MGCEARGERERERDGDSHGEIKKEEDEGMKFNLSDKLVEGSKIQRGRGRKE